MKKILLVLLYTLLSFSLQAQKTTTEYTAIDRKALQVPESQAKTTQGIADYFKANFASNTELARAAFIWTASNIEYDIENMFAINFYEKTDEKIEKSMHTRKGICINYAAVFNDICQKTGLRSYIIEGYTKQNGFTDYIPHAWCAVLIDTSWFLFDPTWGSGYISNNKFVKKINNAYFKAPPSVLIKSHMPFDPLWQFLYYPVTSQEFYEGKTQVNKTKPFFNYHDSISVYEKQSNIEQLKSSSGRIEPNGVKNSMIFDRLAHIKRDIEIYYDNERVNNHNETITLYNLAVADYNEAVNDLNAFIEYRNNQFSPMQSDEDIQNMITITNNKINAAKTKLKEIKYPDANTASLIIVIQRSVEDVKNHVDEQQEFLATYFSKGKSGRKTMFHKYTWMGIPLN